MKIAHHVILTSRITTGIFLFGSVAYADVGMVVQQSRSFSNAEILDAKPFVNPLKAPDAANITVDIDSPYISGIMTKNGPVNLDSNPRAYGTFGIPYTTTRVQDGVLGAIGTTNANRLSTTFPYRTVGKLIFSVGGAQLFVLRL